MTANTNLIVKHVLTNLLNRFLKGIKIILSIFNEKKDYDC